MTKRVICPTCAVPFEDCKCFLDSSECVECGVECGDSQLFCSDDCMNSVDLRKGEGFTERFLDDLITEARKMTPEEYVALHERARQLDEPGEREE